MITDKEYKILMTDVYRKIITAVNITTGDDGTKAHKVIETFSELWNCLLYTSPSPRDQRGSRMPSSA